jgi:hypothetical protein
LKAAKCLLNPSIFWPFVFLFPISRITFKVRYIKNYEQKLALNNLMSGKNPFKQASTLIRTVLITRHTKEGFSTTEFSFENLTQFSTQFQRWRKWKANSEKVRISRGFFLVSLWRNDWKALKALEVWRNFETSPRQGKWKKNEKTFLQFFLKKKKTEFVSFWIYNLLIKEFFVG